MNVTPTSLIRSLGKAAGVLVLVTVLGVLTLTSVPRLLGYTTMVVRSGSMGAAAPTGSVVVGRTIGGGDVRVGDVILIQRTVDGQPVTPVLHRVIGLGMQDGNLLAETRGDANDEPDPDRYLLGERVVTMASMVPLVGYLLGFAKTPLGWTLLVLVPAGAVCAQMLRAMFGRQERVPLPATRDRP